MVKLKGAAKAAFLKRINKGRVKKGLKKIASKTKSVSRKTVRRIKIPKRRKSNNVAKTKTKSRKRSLANELYDKKKLKVIAIKAGIGTGVGIIIKLVGMASRNRDIQVITNRAAPTAAAYAGGGTGELGYQIADFAINRAFLGNGGGGGFGNGFNSGGA